MGTCPLPCRNVQSSPTRLGALACPAHQGRCRGSEDAQAAPWCKSPPGTAQGSPLQQWPLPALHWSPGPGMWVPPAHAHSCPRVVAAERGPGTIPVSPWLGVTAQLSPHCGLAALPPSCLCAACTGFQPGKDRNLGFPLGHSECPGWAAHSPTSPMPSCCPAQRCPSCSSSCPWGCPGLILHLWDARLEEKMGSADLTGPEYQLWQLLRDDVHTAWGSPGCCIGVPIGVPGHCAFSSASLQHG